MDDCTKLVLDRLPPAREQPMLRVVGFSGGIDSQALMVWMRAQVKEQGWHPHTIIALNTRAGDNEHPITEQFVADYSREVWPVVVVTPLVRDLGDVGTRDGFEPKRRRETLDENAPLTFDLLAWVKGRFPSRKAQFCSEYLKLAPQVRWCLENLVERGYDYERYVGVRRDESLARRDTPDRRWDEYFDTHVNYPIASWRKEHCFAVVEAMGEEVNPLYRMGFGRVGCAPCINSSKEDIRNWSARFPEMIDKVREWERRVGRTFFYPCVPGMEINWIDDVVAWSKTARGGRQLTLPLFEEEAQSGGCVSKYGLCE